MRYVAHLVAALGCVLLATGVLVLLDGPAAAKCPSGTVFSAYNGHGICAYIGQGAKAAFTCTVAKGKCPSGTTREHSNSDPKRDYCCPKDTAKYQEVCVWVGTAPFCNGSCSAGTYPKAYSGSKMMGCVTGSKAYCCQKVKVF